MLQIRLLGQFDVRLDGKRVVIPTRAAQSLLAYLVLTAGTPHRREKLAGTLWPETSDESARKNLRQELWRVRKAIPTGHVGPSDDYLLADEFTLTFNRDADYWLDVAILERPDLDPQSLTSGLSLYQGELLPGFYEDWIVFERERIQALFESKMERLVEKLVEAERWTAVQEQCERWLALGHIPEPAYRALMLSHSARGDMAKVSTTYQRCVDDLRDQFGIEPSTETHALYSGLLKGAQSPRRAVPTQPSGTITFLFTDIEASTRLLDKLGDQYANALAEHHKIMRASIQKFNGSEMETQGDAFFVTFARALDAVQCAVEIQRELSAHHWPLNEPLRVRMGLHTGEPLIASTGYVGMDVHRAARIGDAGHGGQILMSQTTRELVIHELPPGVKIRDLGEHRLKDMRHPAPIYQLMIDGLPSEFPPIKTKLMGTEAPTPGEAPFKGLQYYDQEDSDLFFGREILTAKLVNRLCEGQFLSVIIGASGSGKSSIVRAGLIPALKNGNALGDGIQPPQGSADWRVHILTPTAHPLEALATELTRDSESVTATATLMDDLSNDPRSLALFLTRKNRKQHKLIVIDQFEELFTLCRDEFEREAFIDNLLNVTSINIGENGVTVVITLRADFYAHLAQYSELRDAVAQHQEYIGPMTTEELRRAIEEPARRGHWEFEPGLVDLILRDVGDEPGALPLLSHALLETWKRRAGHTLTLKGYADAGGVHGAIAHTAESVYQNLTPEEQTIARNIFLRLTELGEGTEDTRRRASFDELLSHVDADYADEARSVLNILAQARLVTLGEATAEVAHEALIREWPTLREWLNQDRESLRLHRHLTEAAHEWELLERDAGALYRGAHLAQALEWAVLHPNALNAGEKAFLEASNVLEQSEVMEREAQQQRELEAAQKLAETERKSAINLRGRNRVITTIGIVAIVLAIMAGTFGLSSSRNAQQALNAQATSQSEAKNRATAEANALAERNLAQQQALISSVRELSNAANLNLEVDPERSILLALQAVNKTYAINKSPLPEAEDALRRAVQTSRIELTLRGHTGDVWSAVYSSDGTRIVTAGADGTARIWDATTSKELLSVKGSSYGIGSDNGNVYYATFSPDGKLFATAGGDDIARIWNGTTGEELLELSGHYDDVYHVEFSPDGSRLATVSPDGTAIIWDTLNGKELLAINQGEDAQPYWVTFSPDGSRIAVANATPKGQGWTSIWDVATGEMILSLPRQGNVVNSVAFSPDGTRLVTTSDDQTARVWGANTGKELLTLYSQTANITNAAYSPDGTRIATAIGNNQVKVWEAATGRELLTLAGHSNAVLTVGFSPDGSRLITASSDGTARIWNISSSRELLTLVNGPAIASNAGASLAYSPEGTRLAVAYSDPIAKVWDVRTGKLSLSLVGHTADIISIAYNFDGTRIATAARDGTAKIWNAVSGKELLTLTGPKDLVLGVAFSPDGTRIATASWDGTAIVWDAVTGKKLLTLTGHKDHVGSVVFSPDGTRIVTSSWDGTAIVWDAITGKELFALKGHTNVVRQIAFSPDGTRLATASFDLTAKEWDAVSGKELFTLSGHVNNVFSVAFSPDGKTVATASRDGTAKLWDALRGEELLTLHAPDALTGVAISPDGSQLAVASRDGTARIYLLKIEDLLALAKQRVTRSLTTEECQQYLHIATCPVEP